MRKRIQDFAVWQSGVWKTAKSIRIIAQADDLEKRVVFSFQLFALEENPTNLQEYPLYSGSLELKDQEYIGSWMGQNDKAIDIILSKLGLELL